MEETAPALSTAGRMARRRLRLAGALSVALVTTVVAATAHGLASGEWPAPLAVAVALPFSVLLGLPLIGRRVKAWRIGLVVLLDQTLFHLVASSFGAAAGSPLPRASASGHGGHGLLPSPIPAADPATALPDVLPDAAMAAAHLATAALSFAMLRGGWQLVLRAIARGAALLLRFLGPSALARPVPRPRRAPLEAALPVFRSFVLRHAFSRRGPPLPAPLG